MVNMLHVFGTLNGFGRDVGNEYLLGMSAGGVPWYIALSLMWHIYDCLYRDRWASHRLGSPVKCNVCECSRNLRCSAAADRKLRGLLADSLRPSVKGFCVGLFAQQV